MFIESLFIATIIRSPNPIQTKTGIPYKSNPYGFLYLPLITGETLTEVLAKEGCNSGHQSNAASCFV